MHILHLAALAGVALGFADTGLVYLVPQVVEPKYIVESGQLAELIGDKCADFDGVKIYRVDEIDQLEGHDGQFIKHVQYAASENLEDFASLCGSAAEVSSVASLNEVTAEENKLVIVQAVPTFSKRDEVYDEIAQDFQAAESLAAQQDLQFTIMAANGSLFETYQFFSPGIFLTLIVSGLLLFLLVNGLQWLASIEITYLSFEKLVDFEKKNE